MPQAAALARRQQFLPLVQQEAARAGVPWQLLDAVIWQESRYDPNAVGDKNLPDKAYGLGQVRRPAALDVGADPTKLLDPATNVRAAADYLAIAYRNAAGDEMEAAGRYNAGAYKNAPRNSPYFQHIRNAFQTLGTQPPGADLAAAGPGVQPVGVGLGLGSLGQFRGVDSPEPPPLPQVSTALNLPEAVAARPPQPQQLSFREILRYADLEPFDWYPG